MKSNPAAHGATSDERKAMNDLNQRITSHPFFRDLKPEHLAIVKESAKEVKFKAGETIFREGEPASQFYVIESGRVALEAHDARDGTALVQELAGSQVLGWSWLFPPFTWHLQARAIEPITGIALNGGHLLTAAERNPSFGYELMKRVAGIVIQRLQATRKRLLALQIESALDG
jgi:CRP-like cAMP-binding protein